MADDVGFNLLDEPWIVVLPRQGPEREVSILELFETAGDLQRVGGEVPTQAFAIARLLLAFLHRALDGPKTRIEWGRLWNSDDLPMDAIRTYAERVRHRFNLFDGEAPFFQTPGLHTARNEVSNLKKIVADVPDGDFPLFTTRTSRNLERMNPGEAARWLVHVHAFDPSGIKSGAVGDPKVKGGRGYPIGTGWSGQLGGVLPEGEDLRQTLVLNLISYGTGGYATLGGSHDLPAWERDISGPAGDEDRPATGAIDLYTWQTRRVRFVGDRTAVTGVVLSNGDKRTPQNLHTVEPHSAWRYSEPQSKKFKTDVYMPVVHRPERLVWQGLSAMLPAPSGRRQRSDEAQPYLAPAVLEWIGELTENDLIDERYVSRAWMIGVEYGPQSATYSEIVDDRLPLRVAVMREDNPQLGRAAVDAAATAEDTARAVANFAGNVASAAGAGDVDGHRLRAREQVYAVLDQPYRNCLRCSARVTG